MKKPADPHAEATNQTTAQKRRAYEAPRLERKLAVERVTLLSGMGAAGVAVVNMMN